MFGNSSTIQVGDQIITVGKSQEITPTIVTEIGLSALAGGVFGSSGSGYFTTNATIDCGSGGPLFNLQGEVIGMNICQLQGVYCNCIVISSNTIAKEVPSIIVTGSYAHPSLGISGRKISPDLAKTVGLPADYKGVVVDSVLSSSPAEKAGLIIEDIITAVDGHPTTQIDDDR